MTIKDLFNSFIVSGLALLTVITTIAGFIIINIYLGQYNICEYNIFAPKSIYTGAMFIIIVAVSLIVFFPPIQIRYDSHFILNKKNFILNILNFIKKAFFITNVFLSFVLSPKKIEHIFIICNSQFLNHLMTMIFFILLDIPFLIMTICAFTRLRTIKKMYYINIILSLLSLLPFFILIFNYTYCKIYLSSFFFFFIISLFPICIFIFKVVLSFFIDEKKENSSNQESDKIVYSSTNKISLKFFWILYTIYTFFSLLSVYSISVYPLINESFGGGATPKIEISTENNETTQGNVLYHNDQYYYLLTDNNEVRVIKLSTIRSIKNT